MNTPSQEYRRTGHRAPRDLYKGLDAVVNGFFGAYRRRAKAMEALQLEVEQVEELGREYETMSDHLLRIRISDIRDQYCRCGRKQEDYVLPALAAIREAAERQLGLRPYPVQLLAALALHKGYLVEMATGEGKTLTASLAAVMSGWTKRPCHIITVNDYLVKRDADLLQPLYSFCGVRVGCVTGSMNEVERRKGYNADVTYATSKEVLADFLRDRIRIGPMLNPTRRLIRRMLNPGGGPSEALVMRGLHTAIVDEADSVLIDEAVTPLIISTPRKNEALQEVVMIANRIVEPLRAGEDYEVNFRYKEVELTEGGMEKIEEECASLPGIWKGTERRLELVKQALVAREFFLRGKQYIMVEGKIVIVDEFTGRQMPQRSWRQGMHQAIEAKEGVTISDPSETTSRLSFQRFFRLYQSLSGMTGTAREASGEFWQIYRLPVVTIPLNRPCVRIHHPDRIFASEDEKWSAVLEEIIRLHLTGQPVLVGTRSVAASQRLAGMLGDRGVEYRLLNATNPSEEAQIVAVAGNQGRITIATNMAGRGTDIKLGHGVEQLGGLHVLATERHESGRVDRQLFGRSARQGDPGSAQAFVSLEDELIRRHLPVFFQKRVERMVAAKSSGWGAAASWAFKKAQQRAQTMAYKQRKGVLKVDEWMDEALSFAGGEVF